MSASTWHITVLLKMVMRPKVTSSMHQMEHGSELTYEYNKGATCPAPLIPQVQFLDAAGLRDPTAQELSSGEQDIEKVRYYVERAAWLESSRMDQHWADKNFFVIIKTVNNGVAYEAELHQDSLSGPLVRRSVSSTRPRAAELLGAEESDISGPTSVLETPVVFDVDYVA